jgi:RNA polymerase sigma factor (TIGR02999 family)
METRESSEKNTVAENLMLRQIFPGGVPGRIIRPGFNTLAGWVIGVAASTSVREEVTGLLQAWSDGDREAFDKLVPLVYDELHRMANRHLRRERPNGSLQTTVLIHEAYLRLVDQRNTRWQNRTHFYSIAARLMRRILVDHARTRRCAKRGGAAITVTLAEAEGVSGGRAAEVIALDEALETLSELDPRKGQVVELRFFGGLSVAETADVLGVSPNTILRDWSTAKAWLHREMSEQVKSDD